METKSDRLNDWGWVGGADGAVIDTAGCGVGAVRHDRDQKGKVTD